MIAMNGRSDAGEQVASDFKTVLKAYDKLGGTTFARRSRAIRTALQLIETYLTSQLAENSRFSAAVILDYGETLAPSTRLRSSTSASSRRPSARAGLAQVSPEAMGNRLAELRLALGRWRRPPLLRPAPGRCCLPLAQRRDAAR